MEVFSTSNRNRETYTVTLQSSLLWEAALGIAAITNDRLIETLTLSNEQLTQMRSTFSKTLMKELDLVKRNNTWKALLQLLHERDFNDLQSWINFVQQLSEVELKKIIIPFVGRDFEKVRIQAAQGSQKSMQRLIDRKEDNPFYPAYIQYIFEVEGENLKKHLIDVMSEWWIHVIIPDKDRLKGILDRDLDSKKNMMKKLDSESFVEWVTNGVTYHPEPSVYHVTLIPHYIYRPWNVEADFFGEKVFFYPVAKESIEPDQKSAPKEILVQRYKALADETRLIILKQLMLDGKSLKELTDDLKMGKTTIHHHVKLLKAARIVTQDGSYYRVNKSALFSLSKELELYLQ